MSLGISIARRAKTLSYGLCLIPREPFRVAAATTIRSQHTLVAAETAETGETKTAAASATSVDAQANLPTDGESTTPLPAEVVKRHRSSSRLASRRTRTDHPFLRDQEGLDKYHLYERALVSHGVDQSVLVRPAFSYPDLRETRHDFRKHHQSLYRQVRIQRWRQLYRRPAVDWRKVLLRMVVCTATYTPQWHQDALRIIISHGTVNEISAGGDDGIVALAIRTGAHIKLFRGDQPDGSSSLLVSGSAVALNKVTEAVQLISARLPFEALPRLVRLSPIAAEQGDELAVAAIQPTDISQLSSIHEVKIQTWHLEYDIRDVPIPEQWNKKSFEEHILHLTGAQVPAHLISPIYGHNANHTWVTIHLLVSLFQSTETQHAISAMAVKHALRYIVPAGESHRDAAQILLDIAHKKRLPLDADITNLLLQNATQAGDLGYFDFLVRRLSFRADHRMTLDAWILFLRLVQSEEVKRQILITMHDKNLLQIPGALQRVAIEMSTFDALRAAAADTSLDDFLTEQATRYGTHWLTPQVGQRLLDVFARYSKFNLCGALLDHMAANAVEIQTASVAPTAAIPAKIGTRLGIKPFNIVLAHVKLLGKPHLAVQFLDRMADPRFNVRADSTTYHHLFEAAWKARLPTLLQVTWHHATLDHFSTFRMRRRVSALLGGQLKRSVQSRIAPPESGEAMLEKWGMEQQLSNALPGGVSAESTPFNPPAPLDINEEAYDKATEPESSSSSPPPTIKVHKLGTYAARAYRASNLASTHRGTAALAQDFREALDQDLARYNAKRRVGRLGS